jgi:hypothetical protein
MDRKERQYGAGIDIPLLSAALIALLWAVARACVQSITIDEADTYLAFVGRADPSHWDPAANNHVLNSALMRVFTSVFGLSHIAVRLPALMGAAIYIGACVYICALVHQSNVVRLPLFVCLVYNPFVFDFLVAARGYGLATAFLICAVVIPAAGMLRGTIPARICAACSLFVALSFAASFSFVFADLAILTMVLLWTCRTGAFSWRLVAAAILPGAAVTTILSLSTILRWPRGQFTAGAYSLQETFASVIHWSWYDLNPEVSNPLVYRMMRFIEIPLLWALAGVVLLRLVLLILDEHKLQDERSRWLGSLAALLAAATALATALHWLAFRAFGLLLPFNRTALFYVPLFTLFVGAIFSIPIESRMGRVSARAGMGVICFVALHFILSMRLTYFGEWRYDADVRTVYATLASYNHTYCVSDVGSSWLYVASLNFYRLLSGRESFPEFESGEQLPTDAQVYVLNGLSDRDFIDTHKLIIAYRGQSTDVVIAIRPERLRHKHSGHPCPEL